MSNQMMMGMGDNGGPAPFNPADYGTVKGWWNANNQAYNNGDAVSSFVDDSGNGYDLAQAASSEKPTYRTTDGKFVEFDGTDDSVVGTTAVSNIIAAGAFTIFVKVKVDAIGTNAANWYENDALLTDTGGYFGLFLKSAGTVGVGAFDGSTNKDVSTTISTGSWVVVESRFESGTLYISVDGASEQSVASSNISSLTGNLKMGANWNNAAYSDINVRAALIYNTALSSGSRTAIRAALAAL